LNKAQWLRSMGNLLQLIVTTESDAARRVYKAQYVAMSFRKTRKAAGQGSSSH